jgi:rhomboid protease GluP
MTDQSPENPTSTSQPAPMTVRLNAVRPKATYILMGVIAVFYLLQVLSERYLGFDLLFLYLGKIQQPILAGQVWRLITPAFLHGSLLHLASNLYALYVLGLQLEGIYGHRRFLLLFFISAFGGNVLSFVLTPAASLGASTAIFGLLAAEIIFVVQNKRYLGGRSRGLLFNLIFILLLNLSIGFNPALNIDYFGHLGGLIAGGLFAFLAGPKWQLEWTEFQPELKDTRAKREIQMALVIVFLGFCLIAAIPFIFG